MTGAPRILFVVNDAAFFLSHRLPVAVAVQRAGFEAHVATPTDDASAQIVREGLAHHPIPLTRNGVSLIDGIGTTKALVDLYRRLGPTLVHHVTAQAIVHGGLAALATRVPSVVHAISGLGHLFIARDPRSRGMRTIVGAGYALATSHPNCTVIFQNDDDRRALGKSVRTGNVAFVRGSGVDRTRFVPTPLPNEARPIVLLASRMLWQKGVGELVDAAERLRGRARFVLVGPIDSANPGGIRRTQIEAWVKRGVVEWWGPREDMPRVLGAATIVCLPSYREGMPKVLLEACAVGRPVITTDVPGCRDYVGRNDYGCLVPARSGELLARAIASLLDHRETLERMSRSAIANAHRFCVTRTIEETLSVYRDRIASSRNPASARLLPEGSMSSGASPS